MSLLTVTVVYNSIATLPKVIIIIVSICLMFYNMQITLTTLAPLQQSCEVNVMLPILPKQYAKLKLTQGPQAVVIGIVWFSNPLCAKLLQSCPALCDPKDCSLPGSSVRGILQATILKWVGMPSSRGSYCPRDQTCISRIS